MNHARCDPRKDRLVIIAAHSSSCSYPIVSATSFPHCFLISSLFLPRFFLPLPTTSLCTTCFLQLFFRLPSFPLSVLTPARRLFVFAGIPHAMLFHFFPLVSQRLAIGILLTFSFLHTLAYTLSHYRTLHCVLVLFDVDGKNKAEQHCSQRLTLAQYYTGK